MGFRKPDLTLAYSSVRVSVSEISSTYNDGFTAAHCKEELFYFKCWLEDQYDNLPTFSGEEEWYHKRLVDKLRK